MIVKQLIEGLERKGFTLNSATDDEVVKSVWDEELDYGAVINPTGVSFIPLKNGQQLSLMLAQNHTYYVEFLKEL